MNLCFLFKLRLKHYLEKAHELEITSGSYIKHQMYINCELWSWKVNPLMPFSVFLCRSLALMASLRLRQRVDVLFSSSHHRVGFPVCAPVNTQPCEKTVGKFKLRSKSAWVAWAVCSHGQVAPPCVGDCQSSSMTLLGSLQLCWQHYVSGAGGRGCCVRRCLTGI